MQLHHKLIDAYYAIKPFVPRPVQIELRRHIARKKTVAFEESWPILESAVQKPKHWNGWPNHKQFALILRHDVETQAGQEKVTQLVEVEKELGFRSAFYFIPEKYKVSSQLRTQLNNEGFEVGVHGLNHDGKLYRSPRIFKQRAKKINRYMREWGAVGFAAPACHHILDWNYALDILYDTSTFDTDPFQPHPSNLNTIFPKWIDHGLFPNPAYADHNGYVELPYTLPQDFQMFVILQQDNISIWKEKVDWIVKHGGMVHMVTHPDYICFGNEELGMEEYPVEYYQQILRYIKTRYANRYWHALPKDVAKFFSEKVAIRSSIARPRPTQTSLVRAYAKR